MRVLTLLICIFISVAVHAESSSHSSLSGRITDTSGAPLPGAVIELPDLHTGGVADVDGRYEILDLPSGKFLVTVKLLSFATKSQTVNLAGQSIQDFQLSEAVLEQHEVIVTGTSAATEQKRNPAPIQTISAAQMRENVSTNVIDAITSLPGVQQLSTGPAISKPVIRGLGYNRIITLNDGIRQEGQQWGDEHGIEIDDYNVSRVEVLKGPASLSYGPDAIAGVVNILSEEPATPGTIQGNLIGNYQTNNGLAGVHARLAGNQGGINWSAYYTGKMAHDFQNVNDGYVFDSRFRNNDYGASLGIAKSWGNSRLSFTSFNQNLGIAEGERDSATGAFVKQVNNNGVMAQQITDASDGKLYSMAIPNQQILHQKLTWINNFYLANNARIGISLGLQQNTRKEFGDVLHADEPGLNLRLRTLNYDLHYLFAQTHGWEISTGINGMGQQNRNSGVEFLVPDYQLFDIGAYLIAHKDLGAWSFSGGIRGDYRSLKTDVLFVDSLHERVQQPVSSGSTLFSAFDKVFSSPSGSLGLSYAYNTRTHFKANLASGYRAPNIAELAANGVHEGTIRYEYGNQQLKAENSLQGDLGVAYNSTHLSINASLFYNHISHFIYTQKLPGANGVDSIPRSDNPLNYAAYIYEQGAANLFGGELFIDLHPHPLDWLHFENTFSYVQGRFAGGVDSAKYLPNIPGARWLIGLRAQARHSYKQIGGAYLKVELDHYFAQNQVFSAYQTETASPQYSLLNASLGFDVLRAKKTLLSITVAGQNLLDEAYQNHLSRLRYADINNVSGKQGIFGMGRNISLQVAIPITFKEAGKIGS